MDWKGIEVMKKILVSKFNEKELKEIEEHFSSLMNCKEELNEDMCIYAKDFTECITYSKTDGRNIIETDFYVKDNHNIAAWVVFDIKLKEVIEIHYIYTREL